MLLFVKGERIKKIQKKRKIQTLTEKSNPNPFVSD